MEVWQHVETGGQEEHLARNDAEFPFLGFTWRERGGGERERGREIKL